MFLFRNSVFAVCVLCLGGVASAQDPLTYLGAIEVNLPLARIVADPVRPKVYGISDNGEIAFIDRLSWSVEKTISTGRVLRDIDIHPDNNYLTVLDNITGEYWNQPSSVYLIDYDLTTQSPSRIVFADAPLYQITHAQENRIVGVQLNQWVDIFQVDATTGERLSRTGAGYYGGTTWQDPNLFVANSDRTRLYRTDVGLSQIDLKVFDISTDTLVGIDSRAVGSYQNEPVFINSKATSLYVGDLRVNPDNIHQTLGAFPEHILAATGDDKFAFGVGGVYDPVWGDRLQDMPAGYSIMALGESEQYLYTFDRSTQQLHVMKIVPEPSTFGLLGMATLALAACGWLRIRKG